MKWDVPVELTPAERDVARHLKRIGKFYVFLREVRHELFSEEFVAELEVAYGKPRGQLPLPPALLGMVTLLQAYDRVGDADAVVTAKMDKRWQLVLGTLGDDEAPFSQGVLVRFRERMLDHDLDRKLLDRTVQLAKETGKFGWQHAKAALDSSPLFGAGRVEDTWNLIGRAIRKLVETVAHVLDRDADELVEQLGLDFLKASSIKVGLNIDWDDPKQRQEALNRLLEAAERVKAWADTNATEETGRPPLGTALDDLERVTTQDIEPDPDGSGARIKRGVQRDRMPSLGDREMRHGRKSRSRVFNGYKRHIAALAGEDLILGAVAVPANEPEHEAASTLMADVHRHTEVDELLIDRGYLASDEVPQLREDGVRIRCKPWRSSNRGRFTKDDFAIDLDTDSVACPAGQVAPINPSGRRAQFSAGDCATCPMRKRCTASAKGRSISIHPQEELLQELRADKQTEEGREALRQRVRVEHGLARLGQVQGTRARYRGARKNTLDARRNAAVVNLQAIARRQAA
jgi:IS5 family transposase